MSMLLRCSGYCWRKVPIPVTTAAPGWPCRRLSAIRPRRRLHEHDIGGSGDQNLPLSGVRIVDFSQVMMGPVCTQMLGDYGADVIKIERIGAGDLSRSTFEPVAGNDNPIFCSLNRNKRSAAFNLRDPAHIDAVKALVAPGRCGRQ